MTWVTAGGYCHLLTGGHCQRGQQKPAPSASASLCSCRRAAIHPPLPRRGAERVDTGGWRGVGCGGVWLSGPNTNMVFFLWEGRHPYAGQNKYLTPLSSNPPYIPLSFLSHSAQTDSGSQTLDPDHPGRWPDLRQPCASPSPARRVPGHGPRPCLPLSRAKAVVHHRRWCQRCLRRQSSRLGIRLLRGRSMHLHLGLRSRLRSPSCREPWANRCAAASAALSSPSCCPTCPRSEAESHTTCASRCASGSRPAVPQLPPTPPAPPPASPAVPGSPVPPAAPLSATPGPRAARPRAPAHPPTAPPALHRYRPAGRLCLPAGGVGPAR